MTRKKLSGGGLGMGALESGINQGLTKHAALNQLEGAGQLQKLGKVKKPKKAATKVGKIKKPRIKK
jgi:hypothetical protein